MQLSPMNQLTWESLIGHWKIFTVNLADPKESVHVFDLCIKENQRYELYEVTKNERKEGMVSSIYNPQENSVLLPLHGFGDFVVGQILSEDSFAITWENKFYKAKKVM